MKRFWPLVFVIAGLLVQLGAIAYDSAGRRPDVVGIIPPETSTRDERRRETFTIIFFSGVALDVAGIAGWFIRAAVRKSRT